MIGQIVAVHTKGQYASLLRHDESFAHAEINGQKSTIDEKRIARQPWRSRGDRVSARSIDIGGFQRIDWPRAAISYDWTELKFMGEPPQPDGGRQPIGKRKFKDSARNEVVSLILVRMSPIEPGVVRIQWLLIKIGSVIPSTTFRELTR